MTAARDDALDSEAPHGSSVPASPVAPGGVRRARRCGRSRKEHGEQAPAAGRVAAPGQGDLHGREPGGELADASDDPGAARGEACPWQASRPRGRTADRHRCRSVVEPGHAGSPDGEGRRPAARVGARGVAPCSSSRAPTSCVGGSWCSTGTSTPTTTTPTSPPAGEGRGGSSRVHGWMLQHLYPKPDLVLCLDAPADVLYARKQEAPPAWLEQRRRQYLDLAGVVPALVVIDATRPLDDVVADVVAAIEHKLRKNGVGQ